jgi:hypothetical protein
MVAKTGAAVAATRDGEESSMNIERSSTWRLTEMGKLLKASNSRKA